jgi:yecA family protein
MIGNDEDLNFADQDEAQKILGLVMAMYNEVNTAVLERSNALPAGCAFDDDIVANFKVDSPISQWSRGFAAGHDWLSEAWEEYLFDELDEECGATLLVLSFFGSRQLAEAYYAEMAPGRRKKRDTSFEDFARMMRTMFPDALASYAHMGRTIFEVISKRSASDREPARSTNVGRNDPCPCGSGKKYKKCCGGQLH